MKVYVESKYIPEKCSKCKFIGHYENGTYSRNPHCCCELYWDLHQDEIRVDKNSRDERCPLQSLSDYTKQVRKEVIGQVRDIARKIARPTTEYDGGEFDYDIDGVTLDNLLMWFEDEELDLLKNFLDQKQGETNE